MLPIVKGDIAVNAKYRRFFVSKFCINPLFVFEATENSLLRVAAILCKYMEANCCKIVTAYAQKP